MELKTRHIGSFGGRASSIIELTASINGAEITEEVTDFRSNVDDSFIMQLRDLADELEDQNNKIKNQ